MANTKDKHRMVSARMPMGLHKKLKMKAINEGTTLQALLERAVRRELGQEGK